MSIYSRNIEVEHKADNSPLTEADTAAHNLIEQALTELTPDVPILSEESADIPWQTRKTWQTYWLVDPLDGTKEFIKKNGEFTVNVALIENGKAVWGVVHAPAPTAPTMAAPQPANASKKQSRAAMSSPSPSPLQSTSIGASLAAAHTSAKTSKLSPSSTTTPKSKAWAAL